MKIQDIKVPFYINIGGGKPPSMIHFLYPRHANNPDVIMVDNCIFHDTIELDRCDSKNVWFISETDGREFVMSIGEFMYILRSGTDMIDKKFEADWIFAKRGSAYLIEKYRG